LFHEVHTTGSTRDPKRAAVRTFQSADIREHRPGTGLVVKGISGDTNAILNHINASIGLDRAIELRPAWLPRSSKFAVEDTVFDLTDALP
jgi:hypothetical protein